MKIHIGIIGVGYWGPNLVRTFQEIPGVSIKYVADKQEGRRKLINNTFPNIKVLENPVTIFSDDKINVIVIATPVENHYDLAKKALLAGKHVFVEKPFTNCSKKAEELLLIAKNKSLMIGVGHVFTFHPGIEHIYELISTRIEFAPFYISFCRANMRPPKSKSNVIWDLAVHDIAVSNYIFNEFPKEVDAIGYDYSKNGLIDMAMINLVYSDCKVSNIHVNWHTSNKIRNFQMYGSDCSIFFDDMATDKIIIFDKGVDNRNDLEATSEEALSYSAGKIVKPSINTDQPLLKECKAFIESIKNGNLYRNGGTQGLWAVKICEMVEHSIKTKACGEQLINSNLLQV